MTDTTARPRQRAGRAIAGLLDQAFTAGANALNGLVAGVLLGPAPYGRYVAVIGIAFITVAIARAFIGEVLLTHTARASGEEYARQIRNATATAGLVGVLAVIVAVAIWFVGFEILRDLLWLAPFLPAALLQDACRFAFLAQGRPQRSLVVTGIALLSQLLIVTGLYLADAVSPGSLLIAWGSGTVVGSLVGLTLLRTNPFSGRAVVWVSETRHLSAWFAATAVLAQTQTWVVLYFVGGFLGEADLGGLRMLQLIVLMPVQNFIWALTGLIVPGYSHFAGQGDAGKIRQRARMLVSAFTGAAAVLVALVPILRWALDALLPDYREYSHVLWPVAIQAGVYLIQAPLNAALRGMQQARASFVQYAVFTSVILPGGVIGAVTAGVEGVAYGMVCGAFAGLIAAYVLYHRGLGQLTPAAETSR